VAVTFILAHTVTPESEARYEARRGRVAQERPEAAASSGLRAAKEQLVVNE